ncbi:MAG: N-6 DNA methylase [Bacteroidales bacterium]
MKIEPNIIDSKPLSELKSELWEVFDIFRSENITSENYYVVLFLLSLYKDEILKSDFVVENKCIKEQIESALHKSESDLKSTYVNIYKSFEPILNSLSENGVTLIVKTICNLDHKTLLENFSELFDSVLYILSKSQGRYGGEFLLSPEITRLICGLFELPERAKVFNPFAGLASFGVNLDQGQNYFGQELNQKTWALGALRIMAYGRTSSSRYVCEDSFKNWPDESQKFDLIVSNPPYGLRLGNQYRDIEPEIRTAEQFLVDKGLRSLNNEGKLIALLPQGFLFGGMREQQLRQLLVNEDILDTVISLPSGLIPNTAVSLVILVVNKKKKRPGKVRFVRADKFVEVRNQREKFLNDYALNSLIQGSEDDEDSIRIVDNAQIVAWNYNLSVPRYFQKEITLANNERLVKLRDIFEYVSGQRGNLPKNGKFVRIRDLRDDRADFRLNISEIEDVEFRGSFFCQINETCLLLAIRWLALKPTLFVFDGTPIYINQDILSFKINESVADYGYIINELHSDYVQEQLESYRIGMTIPYISRDDLLEVAIKLPSLQEQKAKVKGVFELSNEIQILQDKLNSMIVGESESIYEKKSSLKHRLGTPLLNIGSSLRNIEKALSREFVSWEETKLSERHSITLRESFDSIHQTLKTVHQILIDNEQEISFSNKRLEEIDFLAFIKGYVDRIKSAEKSNVSVKLDINPDIKIQLNNKVLILGNTELLEIGLNAIVENAHMHAFTDDSKKYKLEFRVSLYITPSVKKQADNAISGFDTYIKVEVANNGKPFPNNYTLEKLIRKNSFAGETGNTGQGGFDLNEIIKYHNNGVSTLDLITDSTSEFTTTYSFLIPFNR